VSFKPQTCTAENLLLAPRFMRSTKQLSRLERTREEGKVESRGKLWCQKYFRDASESTRPEVDGGAAVACIVLVCGGTGGITGVGAAVVVAFLKLNFGFDAPAALACSIASPIVLSTCQYHTSGCTLE
jgi:hypothetical protein